MHPYWDRILPALCEWVMSGAHLARHRKGLLRNVRGVVLEIGAGTGLNLPHYPSAVRKLCTIDPSLGMMPRFRKRARLSEIEVQHVIQPAESLPFQDASFDCVVSTWTLCSVADAARSIAELFRVLKPGGRFLFLEHGASPSPSVRVWQRRLNPIQRRFAGCRLDLNVRDLVAQHPFADIAITNFYLEHTPKPYGYMYRGIATK
jgi:ubiquinone/menaquinone biosynthesis C-methylase UbiE